MRTGFEINGDYRLMDNLELVKILVNEVQENSTTYGEECNFEEILNKMTPSNRLLVQAGVELYRRCNAKKHVKPIIKCSTDIFDYMQPILGDNKTEECWAIFMNQASRVIKRIRISIGGYTSCSVDVRVILKEAILSEASAFIICHNHPSCNKIPSSNDDKLTQSVYTASKTLNIRMLDHIIICSDNFYSYADEGRI